MVQIVDSVSISVITCSSTSMSTIIISRIQCGLTSVAGDFIVASGFYNINFFFGTTTEHFSRLISSYKANIVLLTYL